MTLAVAVASGAVTAHGLSTGYTALATGALIFGAIGIAAAVLAFFRWNLGTKTISLQNENIEALKTSRDEADREIANLKEANERCDAANTELKAKMQDNEDRIAVLERVVTGADALVRIEAKVDKGVATILKAVKTRAASA